MATLAETVQELERLKHLRAVWMQTVETLSSFVDQEVRVADKGISAEGCIVTPVPQSVIREFIDRVEEEEIEPLNLKIKTIEFMNVEESQDDRPDGPEGKPKTKRKITKKTNNRSKVGKTRRKIRSINKNPERKDQGVG